MQIKSTNAYTHDKTDKTYAVLTRYTFKVDLYTGFHSKLSA